MMTDKAMAIAFGTVALALRVEPASPPFGLRSTIAGEGQ
jgi:hypothetical protein